MSDAIWAAGDAGQGHADGPTYMHIRDIRQLTGLSENGFRFYEKKGIIHPFREDNGYRVLTLSDGLRLLDAYDLTRFGLTIRQADEVLSEPLEDGIEELRRRSEDMSRELQEMLVRKEYLDYMVRTLRAYVEDPFRCTVTQSAALVFLPVHHQDMSLSAEGYGDGPRWWEAAPLVTSGLLVTVGCDNGGADGVHGPVTNARFAEQRHLPMGHALRFCSAGERCLHFFAKYPAGALPTPDDYAHAFVHLASHGLRMRGDRVLHRMIRHVIEDGVPKRIDEAFMRVADAGDDAGGVDEAADADRASQAVTS